MENQPQNEFNNAIGYIMRLDKIFYLIAQSKINNDMSGYLDSLKILYHELSTEIKDEENIKIKNKLRELRQEIKDIKTQKIRNISEDLLNDIEDIELELRKIYKSSGLQMKMRRMGEFLE